MKLQTERREEAVIMALAAKRGDRSSAELRKTAKLMYDNLTERELVEMAAACRKFPQAYGA